MVSDRKWHFHRYVTRWTRLSAYPVEYGITTRTCSICGRAADRSE